MPLGRMVLVEVPAAAGAGGSPHDSAPGHLLCLSADEQKEFESHKEQLIEKRKTVDGKRGNAKVPEPTQCKRV